METGPLRTSTVGREGKRKAAGRWGQQVGPCTYLGQRHLVHVVHLQLLVTFNVVLQQQVERLQMLQLHLRACEEESNKQISKGSVHQKNAAHGSAAQGDCGSGF